ncbi:MAG TPA: hypothetical protein VH590_01870 [Ktedonobacterales bacterium]
MAVLHFHSQHQNERRLAQQPSRQAQADDATTPDPFGWATGMLLTGIGLALLAGFAGAALAGASPGDFALLFFSCPFLVFGGMLLLILTVESLFHRLRRIQHHCGRCRFYRPLDEGYALGRCRIDPRQRVMQRASSCRFFEYSERAMVRERFAQRAEDLARRRKNSRVKSLV